MRHEECPRDGAAKTGIHIPHQALKINKDSHYPMKKSSSYSSSSSQASSLTSTALSVNGSKPGGAPSRGPGAQRQPVIIYTHSPKVIHTKPQNFMALVQKLTGLCRPEEDHQGDDQPVPAGHRLKRELDNDVNKITFSSNSGGTTNSDETDASSVITEDNNSINVADSQVLNSSFFPSPMFETPPNPYSFPVLSPNPSADFISPNQSNFYSNYSDRLYFGPSIRNTFSSTPTMEMMMMNEFRE